MSESPQRGRLAGQGSSSLSTKAGSRSRKGSLGSRLVQRLRKRDSDDVFEDLAEAVSGPSSFTIGTVDEKAKPEHLVILVNGIAGRWAS